MPQFEDNDITIYIPPQTDPDGWDDETFEAPQDKPLDKLFD